VDDCCKALQIPVLTASPDVALLVFLYELWIIVFNNLNRRQNVQRDNFFQHELAWQLRIDVQCRGELRGLKKNGNLTNYQQLFVGVGGGKQ
jgi:hypothetical protein